MTPAFEMGKDLKVFMVILVWAVVGFGIALVPWCSRGTLSPGHEQNANERVEDTLGEYSEALRRNLPLTSCYCAQSGDFGRPPLAYWA